MNGMDEKCEKCRWRVAYPTKMCMLRIVNDKAKCDFKPVFRADLSKKETLVQAKGA